MTAFRRAAPEPAARRSLRARLTHGPLGAAIARVDLAGYRVARTRFHGAGTERAVATFSKTGEHAAIWFVLGGVGSALDARRRERWLRGTAAVAVAYLVNTAIKLAIRRPRPAFDDLPPLVTTPTQLSFPSAHAASSFAAAHAFAPLVGPFAAPLRALAATMAASRLYLGVHYPSDIVAGALLGTVVGGLARWR
jgi:membrane-associated phospholipid phosphatase